MQNEGLIAQANQLNNQTPSKKIALTPGMVLEIPAPRFLRVTEGETWKSLAEQWLGHEGRAFVLADMNGFKPWHEPEAGQLVVLPYPLIWRSTGNESIAALAYRYLGSTKFAYRLMQFNQLKKDRPDPGTVLLLPIVDLELSPEGRNAAVLAGQMLSQQAAGAQKSDQDELSESLRRLRLELSTGNYVAAVALGNQMLASNVASETTGAKIHQALLESYVALGGAALARESCEELRRLAPDTHLDPLYTSPKIIAICPNPTP